MATKIRMPKIDANVEEGSIGRWLKQAGDPVQPGDPLVEIITDKATFELAVECGGIVRSHVAAEKSVVPVGYVIALLADDEQEPLPDVSQENEEVMRRYLESTVLGAAEAAGRAGADADPSDPSARAARARATPAARRLARQKGVPLEEIQLSQERPIQESDVVEYLRRQRNTEEGRADAH